MNFLKINLKKLVILDIDFSLENDIYIEIQKYFVCFKDFLFRWKVIFIINLDKRKNESNKKECFGVIRGQSCVVSNKKAETVYP